MHTMIIKDKATGDGATFSEGFGTENKASIGPNSEMVPILCITIPSNSNDFADYLRNTSDRVEDKTDLKRIQNHLQLQCEIDLVEILTNLSSTFLTFNNSKSKIMKLYLQIPLTRSTSSCGDKH